MQVTMATNAKAVARAVEEARKVKGEATLVRADLVLPAQAEALVAEHQALVQARLALQVRSMAQDS